MKIKYQYSTRYNFRPGELFGMGKESLTISGEGELEDFIKNVAANSVIKHTDDIDWIVGTEEYFQNEEWTEWIGQPAFFIYDIKIEPIEEKNNEAETR